MPQHVIFVAPFFMEATLRFLRGALALPDTQLTLISQDPQEKLPAEVRSRLAGHWRVDNALNPEDLVAAANALNSHFGDAAAMFGPLEQLQVPLAIARQALGLGGVSVEAARNFRDKARMKGVLAAAGVPCAKHLLTSNAAEARQFAEAAGFPVVVKPPAGAGGISTYRVDSAGQLHQIFERHAPTPEHPMLVEEFVSGNEYSFDSVMIDGRLIWHSISHYMPSPLEVLENDWIQWCVLLPRDISGAEYDPIRAAAEKGLRALGLETGLSHMEWFRMADQHIAISEVGARPPGAQITSLLSYAHDLDFYRAWPQLMANSAFTVPERRYSAGAAYFRGQGRGRVKRIHGLGEAQRRYGELVVDVKLPQQGQQRSDSYEGDGFVIIRHEDTTVVENALRDIVSTVNVELAEH